MRQPRRQLHLEELEDRRLLTGTPSPFAYSLGFALDFLGDAQGSATIDAKAQYYTFVPPQTGAYTITAQADGSELDTVLSVYDRHGRRIGFNDDIDPGFITDSRVTSTLTGGQRYFFQVDKHAGAPGGAYLWSVDGPVSDDRLENNDTLETARNLGTLNAATTISRLVLADEGDWYKFTMKGVGTSASFARINFLNAQGDLDLSLFDTAGTEVASSASVDDSEQISFENFGPGTYYLNVVGFAGAFNPNYSLTIVPNDDSFEDNDRQRAASNLGKVSGLRTITDLQLADAADWFRFTTTARGKANDFVSIEFDNSQGNLDLYLYDNCGNVLRRSTSAADLEQISLRNRSAGTYYIAVVGATNPNYTLTIATQTSPNRRDSAASSGASVLNAVEGVPPIVAAQPSGVSQPDARPSVSSVLDVAPSHGLATRKKWVWLG